jgi:hypothetical protein
MTVPSCPLRAGLALALLLAPGLAAAQPAALPGPASSLPTSRGVSAEKPWRVQEALGLPWLRLGLEQT